MGKLSFMKFYPYDWMNDTRSLSIEAKGCWIEILCLMWNADQRGYWTGTPEEFARVTGSPWESAPRLVQELSKVATVTKRDKEVTFECRRMIREDLAYKNHANRQKVYRQNLARDAKVTPKKLDVRSQKPQTTPPSPPAPPPLKGRNSAPRGAADPAIGRLNKLFYELLELKAGKGARHNFPQSGSEFKRLLKGNEEVLIATTIKNFFESTDTFIVNKMFSWGAYVTNFNVLKSKGAPIHGPIAANRPGSHVKLSAEPERAKQYAD